MSVSEFRRKKLLFVFNVFFDVNQSGTIEENDFEMAVKKICGMRGWTADDSKYAETRDKLLKIWYGLRQGGDTNQDDQISRAEWCQMWEKDSCVSSDWQKLYMDFMFDLQDTSGDGAIDEDEFVAVSQSFGNGASESREAFAKISRNNSVKITRDIYGSLWKDYFLSEDPASEGNSIFGKSSFD